MSACQCGKLSCGICTYNYARNVKFGTPLGYLPEQSTNQCGSSDEYANMARSLQARVLALEAREKELEAELSELKSCPNESWECAREQRRLEAENSRLQKLVDAAKSYFLTRDLEASAILGQEFLK